MARNLKEIQELTERLAALPARDQAKILGKVFMPQMELRLLARELGRKTRRHDPRQIARDVNRTVRQARRKSGAKRDGDRVTKPAIVDAVRQGRARR
jgi:hypothetical protein